MRVLMLTLELPTHERPGTWTAVAREEVARLGDRRAVRAFRRLADESAQGVPARGQRGGSRSNRVRPNVCLVPLSGIPPDQMPVYMNASNVLLMTSHWEGPPNAVKEAMACNLPVVSVEVGDVSELRAGPRGCELHPRDAIPLGDALVRVIAAGEPSTGRARLQEKHLDLESVARRVADVYEDVRASKS